MSGGHGREVGVVGRTWEGSRGRGSESHTTQNRVPEVLKVTANEKNSREDTGVSRDRGAGQRMLDLQVQLTSLEKI